MKGLFTGMDQLEEKHFLGGVRFTWLDLRLCHMLVCFDPVCLLQDEPQVRTTMRILTGSPWSATGFSMMSLFCRFYTSSRRPGQDFWCDITCD
mmetsp:Transcript_67940/g.157683  ORF Transcript_67940/g.157683 Transcript_67940/m.157683 type:complete len:93 (-) Transcript_67940:25-303(-)